LDSQDLIQLIQHTQQGDKSAFSSLYDKFSPALYGVILKIVRQDTHVAEDCLQDAFVKIWKHISTYDAHKGSIFTWMLTIARNTALDKLSSLKAKQIHSLDSTVSIEETKYNTSLNIDTIGISDVMKRLQPEYQTLINMAYYQGMTQVEIADELGLPLGTAKTKIRAAMLSLRNIMT
jgi:RNA polymerase sigma-70 factor (ECF subfamily)